MPVGAAGMEAAFLISIAPAVVTLLNVIVTAFVPVDASRARLICTLAPTATSVRPAGVGGGVEAGA